MEDALLIVHFMGLMLGAGGGLGSTMLARYAGTVAPEQAGVVQGLGPHLARMSSVGLLLMLATGIALVTTRYGGAWSAMPMLFYVKLVFVTTLTLAAIAIEMTYARVRKGDAKAAVRLPMIGPVAGVSSLLAVVFATLAFH